MEFTKGDRVRDKFKRPRPGDDSTEGTVTEVTATHVCVTWDTGIDRTRTLTLEHAARLLEKVDA